MNADFHMHTNFSTDSQAEPEEMIKEAVRRGLRTICITDHQDIDYSDNPKEFRFDVDKYFETMIPLQEKYKQEIDMRIGVEVGMQPHISSEIQELVRSYPFDFVIGSVHVIQGKDPYYRELFQGRTDEAVYRQTFEETLENIKRTSDFDVLGHLDYVVRYGTHKAESYSYRTYADEIDAILKYLIEHGKGLECNTAGFKYGLGFAHPHTDVLKRYRELGGEILTIGSDAHKPEHIAYDFQKMKEILKSCNFQYYAVFKERKIKFIPIEV